MTSMLVPVSRSRSTASAAPLRRSMPGDGPASWLQTALLAVAGVVVFVDIEFGLAYLLYFAVQAVR